MDGYNGWTNYETWCVNLRLGNDEGTEGVLSEMAQDCANICSEERQNDYADDRVQDARMMLADQIKTFVDEMAEERMPDQCSMFADLINSSISCVDWREIADAWLENVDWPEDETKEEVENV